MSTRLHHRLRMTWRSVAHRRVVEQELDEELQFHMQQLAERYAARGAGSGTGAGASAGLARTALAQRDARRRFGGLEQIKEACRDMRTMHPLEDFLRDVRFGLRLLLRSPVFSIVAILSLAIGIGFNSAIFTLVNAIMLRALPVPDAQQLVVATVHTPDGESNTRFGYPAFLDARAALKGQVALAAATNPQTGLVATPKLAGSAEPMQGTYQLVSGEYFDLLKQTPQMGRLISPQDNVTLGGHPVAVISDAFWSRHFGRSPSAIGSEVLLNNASLTIIGVTAPQFFGTTVGMRSPDVWTPIMMQAEVKHFNNASTSNPADNRRPWPPQRNILWLTVFARETQPGQAAGMTQALNAARMTDLAEQQGDSPDADYARFVRQTRVTMEPAARGLSDLRQDMTSPLMILLVMVGLLLLIACANIASLLIARSSTRAREMAIRLSIGAGRLRLVRQLLAESLLLALCGGLLGLVIASWGGSTLLVLSNPTTRPPDMDLGLNLPVVSFTLGVSLFAGLLFGLLPALRSTRVSLSETLRAQSRGTVGEASTSRARLPFGKLLVAAQVAFCLLLLVVAGLFARTLQQLTQVELGLDKDHVVAASLSVRAGGYKPEQLPALYDRLIARASQIPGVTSASVSLFAPLGRGMRTGSFDVEGYQAHQNEPQIARQEIVSANNLQTLGIPLMEGRYFTEADFTSKRRVSIINETMAKKYFRGRGAIGKHWDQGRGGTSDTAFEIIGVVKDARYNDLRSAIPNMTWVPLALADDAYLNSLEVRSTRPTASVVNDLRGALREVEPKLPVLDIMPITDRVNRAMANDQLVAYLTSLFGVVALLLASLGLYGTISYAVSRRTSELGVRLALGASRANVLWLVLREAMTLVFIGLVVGLPLTYLAARGVSKALYGVRPTDLAAAGGAALVLVTVAFCAAYLPARRASRVDPMLALRGE
jgi:predicted permease